MKENEVIQRLKNRLKTEEQRYGKEFVKEYFDDIDFAISALKEIQQYREIGTVEECRDAVEKQKPKKPEFLHMSSDTKYTAKCKCGRRFTADIDCRYNPKFCSGCGVEFDWSEEDERD